MSIYGLDADLIFLSLSLNNKHIYLLNTGAHVMEFTYIDDVVEFVLRLINKIPNVEDNYVQFRWLVGINRSF